jgi:prolyl oligopeptidase
MTRPPVPALAAVTAASLVVTSEAQLRYPPTRAVDQVDTYHGVRVEDPYRWLEDDTSADTAAWVEAQNAVTFAYLARIPFRAPLRQRLQRLYDYPKYTAPTRKGPWFFFSKNDGLQNQSVLYVQNGIDGAPEVLLDPNQWSADGTVRLMAFTPSRDGRHAVYARSRSGSDWWDLHVLEIATRRELSDRIEWVKVSDLAWQGDGFYYSRYPTPPAGQELSLVNEHHQVYFHRLGTTQADDRLVFEDRQHPQRFHTVSTTEDERYAVLDVSDRGTGKKGNALFVRDLAAPGAAFTPLTGEIGDDSFSVVDTDGDALVVYTDKGAPNGRVVRIHPARPQEAQWVTVLPERAEALQHVTSAGGRLFANYMQDVATRVEVFSLRGEKQHDVQLPGLGTAAGFGGERDDTFVFYTFTSFTTPTTIYRYDLASHASTLFRRPEIPGYDPDRFETRQVFVTSKDGTRVPMFLVHKRGLVLDGSHPALLYGYGGFNISIAPEFSPLRIGLLEQGVVYASVNLRGGAEYGEAWHEAGTKLRKQNVFDDMIAAAEWLVANKVSTPARMGIMGGSNGGLLVGAVINQRPDLFRVAVPQVGVMDMLRFHKFTIGWNWIADYGSSDDPEQFKALYAYSPIHNVKAGGAYPAVLITTADHDDRVVPAHSFKYAATMQAKAAAGNPVLIRVETKSGHGASNTAKQIETAADVYAFLLDRMGVTPAFDRP